MFPMKHILTLTLVAAGLVAGPLWADDPKPKPLTEADVLKLIELQRQTQMILARLKKAGVGFKVDDAVIERLRKAGASGEVLAALKVRPDDNLPLPELITL